jgi:hypothetical protein
MIFMVYFAPLLRLLYLFYDFYGLFFAIIWTWYLIYILLTFIFNHCCVIISVILWRTFAPLFWI